MRDIYPTVLGYKLCFSFTCIESDLGIAFSVSGGRVSIIFFLFLKKNHKAPPRLPTHGLTPHTEFRQNVYRRPERPPFVSFDPVDNMVCPSFSATTPAVGIAGSTFGFFFFSLYFFLLRSVLLSILLGSGDRNCCGWYTCHRDLRFVFDCEFDQGLHFRWLWRCLCGTCRYVSSSLPVGLYSFTISLSCVHRSSIRPDENEVANSSSWDLHRRIRCCEENTGKRWYQRVHTLYSDIVRLQVLTRYFCSMYRGMLPPLLGVTPIFAVSFWVCTQIRMPVDIGILIPVGAGVRPREEPRLCSHTRPGYASPLDDRGSRRGLLLRHSRHAHRRPGRARESAPPSARPGHRREAVHRRPGRRGQAVQGRRRAQHLPRNVCHPRQGRSRERSLLRRVRSREEAADAPGERTRRSEPWRGDRRRRAGRCGHVEYCYPTRRESVFFSCTVYSILKPYWFFQGPQIAAPVCPTGDLHRFRGLCQKDDCVGWRRCAMEGLWACHGKGESNNIAFYAYSRMLCRIIRLSRPMPRRSSASSSRGRH